MVQNNVSKTPSTQYGFSNLAEVANNDPLYMRSISTNNLPAPPAPKPLPPLMAYPTPPPMRKYPLPPKPVVQIQPGPNDIPPETAGIFDYMIWSKVNLVIGAIVVGIPGLILSIITRRYKRKGDVKISKIMSKITLAINAMTSPMRSTKKTKKVIRRVSKSPTRRYSPSRIQIDIQLESEESAYSDPVDSTRTLIEHVVFQRRDRENLSPQATQLFNSQIIFEDEAERTWLLENILSTTILIKVNDVIYTINGNYALRENQPTVLFLHGFGIGGNWANWIKLAYPLSRHCRYSVIFVDLPGFGQSSGRISDQTSWKRHGPEILVAILSSFHLKHSVSVVAQCGGAATTVRTISRYPQWFRNRGHVFCNSVIGDFGESKIGDFEANLTRFNIHIVVFWIPDKDHTKYCVAYKRWNKLRLTGFRNLQLIDLDPIKQTMKLFYPKVYVVKISRCSSKNQAHVYKLSDAYIQQIIDILDQK